MKADSIVETFSQLYLRIWNMLRRQLRYVQDHLQPPDSVVLVLTAMVVGMGTGYGAVVFIWLVAQLQLLGDWVQTTVGPSAGLLLLMVASGLIVGFIVQKGANEVEGGGIPEVMEAVALRGGRIRGRVAPLKMMASALTIGTGGSAGREGPMVQIGSALGSLVGQLLHFPTPRVRTLVACGAAAGVSAAFNAPIAASLFALEVVLGKFTVRYFGAVVISAVSAGIVARASLGEQPAFLVPSYDFVPGELTLYALLGILAGLVAMVFVHGLYAVRAFFHKLDWPLPLRTAVGMALAGAIGLLLPNQEVLGDGLDYIGSAIAGDFGLGMAFTVVLLIAKIATTSLTIGSGNSGGVFAPSLFVGATLGGLVGRLAQLVFPAMVQNPGAYAIVGMAAVFSGAARAPITAVLIVFEMSNDYKLIIPLMLSTVLSTLLAEHFFNESIYTMKLKLKGITLHRGRDLDVMQSLTVGEAMTLKPYVVPHDMPLLELGQLFRQTHRHSFPVVDDYLDLVGIVSLRDYEKAREKPEADDLVARDFATMGRLLIAYEDEPLSEAIRRLAVRGVSKMPVVKREKPTKVTGVIRRSDIVRAYNVALARRVHSEEDASNLRLAHKGHMRFTEVEVTADSRVADQQVSVLAKDLPYDCVLVSVRRHGSLLVPHGDTRLQTGDVVQVFVREDEEKKLRHCFFGEE